MAYYRNMQKIDFPEKRMLSRLIAEIPQSKLPNLILNSYIAEAEGKIMKYCESQVKSIHHSDEIVRDKEITNFRQFR